MQNITFNDANDIVVSVNLDDKAYKIRFCWNSIGAFWALQLWNSDKEPLLCNLKLVPNFPILMNHHRPGIPAGEFLVITNDKKLTRQSFADDSASFVYVTEEEWHGTV